MNEKEDITASAVFAMPDMHEAFDALEVPVSIMQRRTRAAVHFAEIVLDRDRNEHGCIRINSTEIDAISSMLSDVRDVADDVERIWTERHNAWTDARAEQGRRKAVRDGRPDKLVELISAYQAGMAAYNKIAPNNAEDALAALTFLPAMKALRQADVPAPTSRVSAIAALRLMLSELNDAGLSDELASALLPKVIAFFEQEA